MVRAILDGGKTVTRRVVKIKGWKITGLPTWSTLNGVSASGVLFSVAGIEKNTATCEFAYPPYKTGDILYVRETWCKVPGFPQYVYRSTCHDGIERKWRPSIHMPKEAARIFLLVTDVRVERLQEITVHGLISEGVATHADIPYGAPARFVDFKNLWDRTIKKADIDLYGWDANPWVWVIEFERCEKPEGE